MLHRQPKRSTALTVKMGAWEESKGQDEVDMERKGSGTHESWSRERGQDPDEAERDRELLNTPDVGDARSTGREKGSAGGEDA